MIGPQGYIGMIKDKTILASRYSTKLSMIHILAYYITFLFIVFVMFVLKNFDIMRKEKEKKC